MIKKYILILILFLPFLNVYAQTESSYDVNIYFFHSNTCPHCIEEEKLLKKIESKYNNVHIYKYEIHESNNKVLFDKVAKYYKMPNNSVPVTIIADTVYSGYNEKEKLKFIKTIAYYNKYGSKDICNSLLEINNKKELPNLQPTESLDQFIKEYKNYKLIYTLKTDNIDLNTSATIMGVLNAINKYNILFTIIFLMLVLKINNIKSKIIVIATYYITLYSLMITFFINSKMLYRLIFIIFLIIIMSLIIKCIKKSIKEIKTITFTILASFFQVYMINKTSTNIYHLKQIVKINLLSNYEKVATYITYFIANILINIIIMYIIYLFIKRVMIKLKDVR